MICESGFVCYVLEKLPEQLEDDVAQKLYALIEHFKQENPVGLPAVPIPDPMVTSIWTLIGISLISSRRHLTPTF